MSTTSIRPRGRVALVVTGAALAALPLLVESPYTIYIATIGLVYAMLAASWDILTGYSGQLSFGHAGFFGAGAYAAVLAVFHYDLSPWLALLVGAAGGGVIALAVGGITLRLRGPYLALMTLGVAQILALLVLMNGGYTRGSLGLSGYEGLVRGSDAVGYYYIALVLAVGVTVALYAIGRSRYGLILRAIRDDELKVRTMGINSARHKVAIFTVSGAVAGLAGAYYGFMVQVLTPDAFDPVAFSGLVIGMAIMGGMGTVFGPAIFAVIYGAVSQWLTDRLGPGYDVAVLGVLIVLAVVFLPEGLWPHLDRRGRRRWLPRRRSPASSAAS